MQLFIFQIYLSLQFILLFERLNFQTSKLKLSALAKRLQLHFDFFYLQCGVLLKLDLLGGVLFIHLRKFLLLLSNFNLVFVLNLF